MKKYLKYSEEVAEAIDSKKAVVALESTIISHGMPYPQNVETAIQVEKAVRDTGAIPATIGIINGKLCAGLSMNEIEIMGKMGQQIMKCSRRDLPLVIAKKTHGATTVAGTMIIAEAAGIKVFATGGIGGVHRGASQTMDVSADLQELARTNVAVVCAGAKAILDIGLTLEYLETHGVPVIAYQTKEFPAFFTRQSGFQADFKMDTPEEIAALLQAKWELDLKGGVIIGNPIPADFEMDNQEINVAIEQALKEADEQEIKGKEITPFLLARVKALTEGRSLSSNIQLVLNNARLASKVAIALKQ